MLNEMEAVQIIVYYLMTAIVMLIAVMEQVIKSHDNFQGR